MAIDLYRSEFTKAKDANEYIDIDTIMKGCSMMSEAADKIKEIMAKIRIIKETCDADALSVEGITMEDKFEEYEDNTYKFYIYIRNLANNIKSATQREFNKRQTILNEEAKEIDLNSTIENSNKSKE